MIDYLRILLLPFSFIYLLLIIIRNFLYDKGVIKSYKISKPVISIGNITTGGTGKSPFTIFLAKQLFENNIKPAIVSRGYKRKSDKIEIVYNGSEITSTIDKCGDEPLMMANSLSQNKNEFFIVTGSDRVETANFTINRFNPDIIILDDAYQHRKIKRDLDIVLIDAEDMVNNKMLNSLVLPAGNLRENFSKISGADVIIQNNKFSNIEIHKRLKKFGKDVFILRYKVIGFFDINGKQFNINGKDVCAFAGIAKPDSFFTELKKYNLNSVKSISFRDHQDYSSGDISQITLNAPKETYFVTTEKDFIKIRYFKDFLKYFNVLFMKIELILDEPDKFLNIIQENIKNKI